MLSGPVLPDPVVVVLVGASGAGKSHWAARRFRSVEIVSSDQLRSVVGSGAGDLEASDDAFDLLDRIADARIGRGLSTVVDTLGLEPLRRRRLRQAAHDAGLPAVAVVVDTAPDVCRRRNARRDRPVPADVLRSQLRRARDLGEVLDDEDWDLVVTVDGALPDGSGADPAVPDPPPTPVPAEAPDVDPGRLGGVVLQVSRFPWGQDPSGWLVDVARAAEEAGFAGLALMDHLIQVPQVGRPWDDLPDPLVTLGALATTTTRLALGTLVSPVTFRAPGVLAKAMATLDVLSAGRAFCGVGAGWFAREHAAVGLAFPGIGERQDALTRGIEILRALWAPGTRPHDGPRASLPETTAYPRPVHDIPIVVGGGGHRTLGIAARHGDASNVRTSMLARALPVLREHAERAGRVVGVDVAVTALDLPVVGRDREDLAARVERLRGRTDAATFARTRDVGTVGWHRVRLETLAESGVSTVFLAPPDLDGVDDVERLAPLAGVDLA